MQHPFKCKLAQAPALPRLLSTAAHGLQVSPPWCCQVKGIPDPVECVEVIIPRVTAVLRHTEIRVSPGRDYLAHSWNGSSATSRHLHDDEFPEMKELALHVLQPFLMRLSPKDQLAFLEKVGKSYGLRTGRGPIDVATVSDLVLKWVNKAAVLKAAAKLGPETEVLEG